MYFMAEWDGSARLTRIIDNPGGVACRFTYGASFTVSRLTQTTLKKVPSVNTNDTTPIIPVARKNGDVGVGLETTTPIVNSTGEAIGCRVVS